MYKEICDGMSLTDYLIDLSSLLLLTLLRCLFAPRRNQILTKFILQ